MAFGIFACTKIRLAPPEPLGGAAAGSGRWVKRKEGEETEVGSKRLEDREMGGEEGEGWKGREDKGGKGIFASS